MISAGIMFTKREVAKMSSEWQIELLKTGRVARIYKYQFGRCVGYCITYCRNGYKLEVFNINLAKAKLQFIEATNQIIKLVV